jgi:hypothetical protein
MILPSEQADTTLSMDRRSDELIKKANELIQTARQQIERVQILQVARRRQL